jgi:hypothetical protein
MDSASYSARKAAPAEVLGRGFSPALTRAIRGYVCLAQWRHDIVSTGAGSTSEVNNYALAPVLRLDRRRGHDNAAPLERPNCHRCVRSGRATAAARL